MLERRVGPPWNFLEGPPVRLQGLRLLAHHLGQRHLRGRHGLPGGSIDDENEERLRLEVDAIEVEVYGVFRLPARIPAFDLYV